MTTSQTIADQINAQLKIANGRRRERLLDYADVMSAIHSCLTRHDWVGWSSAANVTANCYRNRSYATRCAAVRECADATGTRYVVVNIYVGDGRVKAQKPKAANARAGSIRMTQAEAQTMVDAFYAAQRVSAQ